MNLVASGNHIFVTDGEIAVWLAGQNCKLQIITVPDIFVENESFIFRKKDPRLPQINRATTNARSFINHLDEKYRKALEPDCLLLTEDSSFRSRPLDLTTLSGTLFLLLIGSGCALGILAMELCVWDTDSIASHMMTHLKSMLSIICKYLHRIANRMLL